MNGKLIVIEGLDGSGKSTQLEALSERVSVGTDETVRIKLPDYESESSALVRMYLAGDFGKEPQDVNAYAASAFYAVDRVANFKTVWKKNYENGALILADRYTASNAYHQMQKLTREEWDGFLEWLEDFEYVKLGIPKPDAVIFLDMPIDVSQKLMTKRYSGDESKKDIHEANVEYLKSCRECALYAADKLGWKVIPCSDGENPLSIEEISEKVYEAVKGEFENA